MLRGLAAVGATAGLGSLIGGEAAAAGTTWRPSASSSTMVTGTRSAVTTSAPRSQIGSTPAPAPVAPAPTGPATDAGNAAALLSRDPALHAARRLTFGPTPALVEEIRRLGVSAWVEQQLNPAAVADTACDTYLQRFPLISRTSAELQSSLPVGSYDAMHQSMRATVVRAIWSRRQLFELMVDFWTNHFNTTTLTPEIWDLKSVEDRQVVRRHALGRFADLLKADAKSPCMLRYLNQAESIRTAPNENYARELLELHTVGVGGGYTETDVKNAARLLTGMTVAPNGTYTFRADWHHLGPIRVMGWSHPNATAAEAPAAIDSYLDYLARHPMTARRLMLKLCRRLVSDHPPAALVDRLAQVYLDNDTAIVPVLRALVASPEFAASIGQKERRPYEDLIATMRVLGITLESGTADLEDFVFALITTGNAPSTWGTPDGFPDVAEAWANPGATLTRWNVHMRLALGWWNRDFVTPGLPALVGNPASSIPAGQLLDRVCDRLLFQRMRAEHRSAVLSFMGLSETSPAGGWIAADQLGVIAGLVLDSAYWGQR